LGEKTPRACNYFTSSLIRHGWIKGSRSGEKANKKTGIAMGVWGGKQNRAELDCSFIGDEIVPSGERQERLLNQTEEETKIVVERIERRLNSNGKKEKGLKPI